LFYYQFGKAKSIAQSKAKYWNYSRLIQFIIFMKFNKIDLNKYRTEEVSSLHVKEGVFSDGRPYIEECWIDYDWRCTVVTLFLPSVGFKIFDEWSEDIDLKEIPDDIQTYLEREGYKHDFFSKGVSLMCFGREDKLLSINVLREIWPDK
jgi:hypothetical protein